MKLKPVTWLILAAMYEDPDRTTEEILNEIRKVTDRKYSLATVSRHIQKLKDEKVVTVAQANIDLQKLGLDLHFFLLIPDDRNKEENIRLIELFCDAHPYTIYRNMVFGDVNGILTMFILPSDHDSLRYLVHAFDILKTEYRIISDYETFAEAKKLDSRRGNMAKWNIEKNKWDFNISQLEDIFNQAVIKTPLRELPQSILHKLNYYDIILIRELTRNTLRTQKEIIQDMLTKYSHEYSQERHIIEKSQQTISRHFRLLKEWGVYRGSELSVNPEYFDLFIQAMYIIKYETLEVSQLLKAINDAAIPFPNNLYQSEDKIFLWVQLPPKDFAELTRFFYEKFTHIRVLIMGGTPMRYYLWHRNYDPSIKSWKSSIDWIANTPLKELQKANLFPVEISNTLKEY